MNNQTITITNLNNTQSIGVTQTEGLIIDVRVNGNSVVYDKIAYVVVPTKTSDLTNDSGFITTESDPTVPSVVKSITSSDITNWNNKQATLVSGTNIKTINDTSILGSGNIEIEGTSYSAGTGISIENNTITNTVTSYNSLTDKPTIPSTTSALTNDSGFITKNVNDLTNYYDSAYIDTELDSKQDTLVSGTNIKTINNNSLLGSGNISTLDSYSTTEQVVGTWTDGKPIYRKTIVGSSTLPSGYTSMLHNVSNIGSHKVVVGAEYKYNNVSWGNSYNGDNYVFAQLVSSNDIGINVSTNWNNLFTPVITIEYTKTTD